MTKPFNVGDTVRLNDFGIRHIGGLRSAEQVRQSVSMRVTRIENINPPGHEEIWTVQVDAPLINDYLLIAQCFDVVSRGVNPRATRYERWGTPTGRNGIQRTLDERDAEFVDSVRIVDGLGNERTPSIDELNAMGVRRSVAAMDIRTGEMRFDDGARTPIFVVRAGR